MISIVWQTLYMKLCERFLTSFEMTINVLCLRLGVGWRRSRQPTPIPNKDNVMICHSERSEESTIFNRTKNGAKLYDFYNPPIKLTPFRLRRELSRTGVGGSLKVLYKSSFCPTHSPQTSMLASTIRQTGRRRSNRLPD